MAVRKVIYYPDDPLTRKAKRVQTFGPRLAKLVQEMFETMCAYEGVGLAAPQVGVSQRVFVLCEPQGEPICLVNPELSDLEGSELSEEGCLSMPRIFADVPRATRLRVCAQDQTGEPLEFAAENFLARIIQHEFDHIEGILFPERLDILTRQDKYQEWERVREELLAEETRPEHAS